MKKLFLCLAILGIFQQYIYTQNRIEICKDLTITKLSHHVYIHTSFFQSTDFGKVSCNGMMIIDSNEAILFDTPTSDSLSEKLIDYVENHFNAKIIAVIPTHFHQDCLGGLKTFHQYHIPSYAYCRTIALTKEKKLPIPQHSFDSTLILSLGKEKIYAQFVGEGHTKDNIIGYFPKEETLFGGCLIKELGASKGNLEDANTQDWSGSVLHLKTLYPNLKTIIPGHGKQGNNELLDFTIDLFQ